MGKEKERRVLIPNIDGRGNDLIEIREHDPDTGRVDSYKVVEGSEWHLHNWIDPNPTEISGDAGHKIRPQKK